MGLRTNLGPGNQVDYARTNNRCYGSHYNLSQVLERFHRWDKQNKADAIIFLMID